MQTEGNSRKSVIEKQKHFPTLQLITEATSQMVCINLVYMMCVSYSCKKWGVFAELIINKYNCVGFTKGPAWR